MDESVVDQEATPGLSCFVDVFDRVDLFDRIDNQAVVHLSSLGKKNGFSSIDSVQKSTGILLRRMLKPGVTAADLATAVFDKLCRASDCKPTDFSAILLCHSGVDDGNSEQLAATIERHYGLSPRTVRPFNFGCSGFLKLLHEGTLMLADHGNVKSIALLNVETPETWHDGSDRLFCGIVSAGATAVVLERNSGIPVAVVRTDDFEISPALRPNPHPLFWKETGQVYTFRGETITRTVMRMNAETVFLNGIELMLNNLRSAVTTVDLQPGQRVIVIPHQPSGKLLKALIAAAKLEYPDFEYLNNLSDFGNTISAAVPTVMARLPQVLEQNGRPPICDGDLIVLLGAGICMREIENHMSAGHACLEWVSAATGVNRIPEATLAR